MLISVIIPTCNRNDLLAKCLDCLFPDVQKIDNDLYEIIVSDDGKEKQAKNLILEKYSWVKWVEGPKRGPAANRNNAAKYAKGAWLVFLDDDILPDKNLLNEYEKAIDDYPEVLAFEGAILPDDWTLLKKDMAECPVNTNGGCFWSANICINKNLFKKINGFDEQFVIAAQEDQDIYIRIKELSSVFFIKTSIVVHPIRFGNILNKLKTFSKRLDTYVIYLIKNNEVEKVGFLKFTLKKYSEFFYILAKNVKKIKIGNSILSFSSLIFGIPCLMVSYLLKKSLIFVKKRIRNYIKYSENN